MGAPEAGAGGLTEKEFQSAVVALAQMLGWRCAHFRPAQTGRGWRTPVAADGAGFPDLVMVRGSQLLVRELKAGSRLSQAQSEWLAAFRAAGVDADVWTDDELQGRVIDELRRAA